MDLIDKKHLISITRERFGELRFQEVGAAQTRSPKPKMPGEKEQKAPEPQPEPESTPATTDGGVDPWREIQQLVSKYGQYYAFKDANGDLYGHFELRALDQSHRTLHMQFTNGTQESIDTMQMVQYINDGIAVPISAQDYSASGEERTQTVQPDEIEQGSHPDGPDWTGQELQVSGIEPPPEQEQEYDIGPPQGQAQEPAPEYKHMFPAEGRQSILLSPDQRRLLPSVIERAVDFYGTNPDEFDEVMGNVAMNDQVKQIISTMVKQGNQAAAIQSAIQQGTPTEITADEVLQTLMATGISEVTMATATTMNILGLASQYQPAVQDMAERLSRDGYEKTLAAYS
jgi:hypothetical protein